MSIQRQESNLTTFATMGRFVLIQINQIYFPTPHQKFGTFIEVNLIAKIQFLCMNYFFGEGEGALDLSHSFIVRVMRRRRRSIIPFSHFYHLSKDKMENNPFLTLL